MSEENEMYMYNVREDGMFILFSEKIHRLLFSGPVGDYFNADRDNFITDKFLEAYKDCVNHKEFFGKDATPIDEMSREEVKKLFSRTYRSTLVEMFAEHVFMSAKEAINYCVSNSITIVDEYWAY